MEWFHNEFLSSLFCIVGGVGIATIIVSNFMRNDLIFEDDNDDFLYEKSNYEEFEKLEEKDHSKDFLDKLQNKWTIEDTPFGEIIMTYKSDSESFWYYADRKNIPYLILDAVAQRFAIDNECKSVCINYKEEYNKGVKELENSTENADVVVEKAPVKRRKDIYASLKSYNMKKTSNNNKKYVLTTNANRFSYKGNTSEWVNPQTDELNDDESRKEKVGYAAFKQGEHKFKYDDEKDD